MFPNITVLSDTVFYCSDIALNPSYIKFDWGGGQIDSAMITVEDSTPPVLDAKSLVNLTLGPDGKKNLSLLDLLNSLPSDNCGVDTVYFSPQFADCSFTGGYSPIGVKAIDVNGNEDSVTVWVLAQDMTPPLIVPIASNFYLDSLGQLTLNPDDIVAVFDSCGVDTAYINKSMFGCADTGFSSVFVTAIDVNSNQVSTNIQIHISDTTAPAFNILPSLSVYLDATGNVNIGPGDLISGPVTDACGVKDSILSISSFTCFNAFTQKVFVSVSDLSGNTTVKSSFVTPLDTLPPQITSSPLSIFIDTTTGFASFTYDDLVIQTLDNCSLDSNSFSVTPSQFGCDSLGFKIVKLYARDIFGNEITTTETVEVKSHASKAFEIDGPDMVCKNSYNVKYRVINHNNLSDYRWKITGGKLVSLAFKGREAYIHWNSSGPGYIEVLEENGCSSGIAYDTVYMSGVAPDTATIIYWNPVSKTTLFSTAQNVNYFQWGYDVDSVGQVFSKEIQFETQNAYYNPYIKDNIDLGVRYWCETSVDSICWTRTYFENQYPIGLPEHEGVNTNVWPVPFGNIINVESDEPIYELELYDMLGNRLYKKGLNGERTGQLGELQGLPSATFTLTITYKNGFRTNHKLIHVR